MSATIFFSTQTEAIFCQLFDIAVDVYALRGDKPNIDEVDNYTDFYLSCSRHEQ